MKRGIRSVFLLAIAAAALAANPPVSAGVLNVIAAKTQGMKEYPGFFNFYWDENTGKIWLEIDRWNESFLYIESLPNGVGSNDIGLDRGQPGDIQVVRFERSGPRVLLVAENEDYRAPFGTVAERHAVHEAFAQSVLWGFKATVWAGNAALVDATDFYLHDAHHIHSTLEKLKQGDYKLDPSRSAIYLPRTKNFPENTEVESTLTFTGGPAGRWLEQVTPESDSVTVREHFSFVKLPSPGFKPRAYDPRCGFFNIRYMDFSAPVDQPIVKRFITRWRLEKKDPSAASSEPVKPLVYYVDRAIPEPIRSAVMEGASWWSQAFTAAGFKDAFQVKLLPPGADPMDVRYNVIEWVPRRTRGWSYGTPIYDPRTGEIINGHVNFDSLRIRQDFLIAQGLLDPFNGNAVLLNEANQFALARIRQLAAHETGHTLGMMHNFAGSIVNRASVMDYPAPVVTVGANGAPDVSNAYARGIGAWDKVAIDYGYREFPPGTNQKQALDKILTTAFRNGLIYLSDADARPLGSASPTAHLWDVGPNPLAGLKQVMAVRDAALKRLSLDAIPKGAPVATLEDVLVPVFLYDRYQVTAAAKLIGGLNYAYTVRGGVQAAPQIVPAGEQRDAIRAVLATIGPGELAVPQNLLSLIPPRPPGYSATREDFVRATSPAFDPLAPARAMAVIVSRLLLNPERAERMIEDHSLDPSNPGFDELTSDLLRATWKAPELNGYDGAIERAVDNVVLEGLMALAANPEAPAAVRAVASLKLNQLKVWLSTQLSASPASSWRAPFFFARQEIERFQKNPIEAQVPAVSPPPPGSPIGSNGWE